MSNWFKQILCYTGVIHDYRISKQLSDNAVKCQCIVCGKEVAYNHDLQICIPWDDSVEQFYKGLSKKAKKKTQEESDYVKMKSNCV